MERRTGGFLGWIAAAWAALLFIGAGFRVLADCSSFGLPFTDLGATGFCAQIAEAYYTGLSNGTGATTYSPSANVPREQMAAFVTRTLDQSLLRGSRRAGLDQWWTQTPQYNKGSLGLTGLDHSPNLLKSDGIDVWVANGSIVSRIRASDGRKLEDWTGATGAFGVLVAMGRVFVTGIGNPGSLYMIDPSQTPGAVTTLSISLGENPFGIAFDGSKIWTANGSGSVSVITPGATVPWSVTTVSTGFSSPAGMIFDGNNVWVTDNTAGTLHKLDAAGGILQTVAVGSSPLFPAFDGHNIWIPNVSASALTVVRASDGTVLKTFSAANGNGNGLSTPIQAAFDGQRILVTNQNGNLSLFKATDLSIIGNFPGGESLLYGACSDGVNFWVSFSVAQKVGRY